MTRAARDQVASLENEEHGELRGNDEDPGKEHHHFPVQALVADHFSRHDLLVYSGTFWQNECAVCCSQYNPQ